MTGRLDDVVARKVGHLTRTAAGLIAPASISRNVAPEEGGTALHHGGDNVPIASHASCLSTWRGWQRYHMGWRYTPNPLPSGHGWVDIAYTLGACQHGYTLAGRGAGIRTAANGTTIGNLRYLAIVWVGGRRQTPTQAALDAIAHALDELRRLGAGDRVVGHSDLSSTSCPHPTILGLARRLDRRPIPRPSAPTTPVLEEADPMRLIHIGKRGGIAYELVADPIDAARYALRPVPSRDAAVALTGDDDWHRSTVVLSPKDAEAYRILG